MTDTGLIAPIPHLNDFCTGSFHLILDHLLDDPTYLAFYQVRAQLGDFIVLDCSTHELGEGERPDELLKEAANVGVSEIVAPDVLFNPKRTIERTTDFLVYARKELGAHPKYSFMLVPQSESIFEFGVCLARLVEVHQALFKDVPFTIGLSKDYEVWEGGLHGLIQRFILPMKAKGITFNLHLLGWGRYLYQLSALTTLFPWIRSTDSAKPFVYASQGIALDLTRRIPEYPSRPDDYFHLKFQPYQLQVARNNVAVFQARAGQYSTIPDEVRVVTGYE